MRLEEAIKELTKAYNYPMNSINVELHDATNLGIEALRRIKYTRLPKPPLKTVYEMLPGETED